MCLGKLIMSDLTQRLAHLPKFPATALFLVIIATVAPGSAIAISRKVSQYYQVEFEPGTATPTTRGRETANEARISQTLIQMDRFEIWGHGDAGQSGNAAQRLADERMTITARMLNNGVTPPTTVIIHGNDGTIPIERPVDAADPSYGIVEIYLGDGPSDQDSGKPWRHGQNGDKPRALKPKHAH